MQISGLDLIQQLTATYPPSLALPGDPVGVQLGNPDRLVHKVLVTLDVRPETVAEAVATGCDMIVAHHPAMFIAAQNLDLRDPQKVMYAEILKHDLLVFAAHTNMDNTHPGMNDWLASQLGLVSVRPLPTEDELNNMGCLGDLPDSLSLHDLVMRCKTAFNLTGLRVIANDLTRSVKRVAILGGSAARTYPAAKAAGADVYITGDVSYHTGHDMLAADMPVIDVGHHVEQVMKQRVTAQIEAWAQENDWSLEVVKSELNTDPFRFVI